MKVKLTESFRIRIMLYTCISLLAAVLVDMAVLLFCIRSRILVSDYGLNAKNKSSCTQQQLYDQQPDSRINKEYAR